MSKSFLLTIAIPTYNRAPLLERALRNIASILNRNFLWNDIEIIVADNGSSDQTKAILAKFPEFTSYSHPKNLGYDLNVLSLFRSASGEYVIFISDDDLILEEGLLKLIAVVTGKSYDCVITNFRVTNNSISVGGFDRIFSHSQALSMDAIKDALPFYFISSFAIKTNLSPSNKYWSGTSAMQMDIVLSCLDSHSKIFFIKDCVVEQKNDLLTIPSVNKGMASQWKIHLGFAMVKRKYQKKFGSNLPIYMEAHALLTFFPEWVMLPGKIAALIDFIITCVRVTLRNLYPYAD